MSIANSIEYHLWVPFWFVVRYGLSIIYPSKLQWW